MCHLNITTTVVTVMHMPGLAAGSAAEEAGEEALWTVLWRYDGDRAVWVDPPQQGVHLGSVVAAHDDREGDGLARDGRWLTGVESADHDVQIVVDLIDVIAAHDGGELRVLDLGGGDRQVGHPDTITTIVKSAPSLGPRQAACSAYEGSPVSTTHLDGSSTPGPARRTPGRVETPSPAARALNQVRAPGPAGRALWSFIGADDVDGAAAEKPRR